MTSPAIIPANPPSSPEPDWLSSLEDESGDPYPQFPQELKNLKRWVVWKTETREGKPTKVPYNPKSARRADTTDPATWSDYKAALAVADQYQGIGCVIQSPYVGIDLDKCRNPETGEVEPWAKDIIDVTASYAELSPSGQGFHIWVKGALPPEGRRKGRVEMYDGGRYFTVTGKRIEGSAANVERRDLTSLHSRMVAGLLEPKQDEIVARDKSHSEQDYALCRKLAVQFGSDPKSIDEAFRKSELMRPKWDEKRGPKTYGERTIAVAIKWVEDHPAVEFVDEDTEAPPEIVPPFPNEVLEDSLIGDLVHVLSDGTAIPPVFLYQNIKSILGAICDGRIGFPNHADLHTRHYVVNVSTRPRTGKGESWKRTGQEKTGHLYELLAENSIEVVDGGRFGSGEHLVKVIKKLQESGNNPRSRIDLIARFDEMSEPFSKARAQGSILEAKLLQLYERNEIAQGSFKNGEYEVEGVHFSLSGDFTQDSFISSFTGTGSRGSGFLARCVFGLADKVKCDGDWAAIDSQQAIKILARVRDNIENLDFGLAQTDGRLVPHETDEAKRVRWEFCQSLNLKDLRFVPELDSHLKRDLLLRAIFSRDRQITPASTYKSIAWANYQYEVRSALWPEDSGTLVSQMEVRITRALRNRRFSASLLASRCHVDRPDYGGYEVFNRALRALQIAGKVVNSGVNRKGKALLVLVE
jgi:hypothetical protein